jgi:excisionase family DNA binding protein
MKSSKANKPSVPRFADLPEMVTPEAAGAFLQVSRNTTYELIRSKALRSVRFGRLIRIPKDALLGESSK